MILGAVLMAAYPDRGYLVFTAVLGISLLIGGIRTLIYYFTMARHMVGGKTILYKAVILLDLGVFAMSLTELPRAYVILYMIGAHVFSGVVDILHALEGRRMEDPKWKRQALFAAGNLVVALLAGMAGLVFHSSDLVVYIYCVCLIYTAVTRIAMAFKRTAIVYIQ